MVSRLATFIKVTTEELEAANRKLNELAVTDVLAAVGNKTAYFERVRELESHVASGTVRFCVAVFDLNGLKAINDSYGHEAGDRAIVDAADHLKAVFGRENLYRIGGDEFIALLEDVTGEAVQRQFEKLRADIDRTNQHKRPYVVPLSLAMGASAFKAGEDNAYQEVFRRADEAMYRDKMAYYQTHDRKRR